MNCAQRLEQAIAAARALENYEKKPEKMEPLRYTELYAEAIRRRVEYRVCCEPLPHQMPVSFK